jgi:hypothetical protein
MKRCVSIFLICICGLPFFVSFILLAYALVERPDLYRQPVLFRLGGMGVAVTELWGGQVAFFNYSAPYSGSMLGAGAKIASGMDFYGVYFRRISFGQPKEDWWTLWLSLWYPICIFGVPFVAALLAELIRKRVGQSVAAGLIRLPAKRSFHQLTVAAERTAEPIPSCSYRDPLRRDPIHRCKGLKHWWRFVG